MQENGKRNWLISTFGPNIFLVAAYLLLLVCLFWSYNIELQLSHFKLWSILLTTLFFIYLTSTLVQHMRFRVQETLPFIPFAGKKLLRFVVDWFPLVAFVTIYENLREYTGVIRPDSIDAILYKLDIFLFGVEPTVWVQKYTHPLLTEYFAFTYSLYLVLPLSLAWLLYLLNKRQEFHTLNTAAIVCLSVGFLMYIAFPAGPPRFFIPELYDPPILQGAFGYYNAMQARFDAVNPMTYRASFPSLHVAISGLALVYATKFRQIIPFGRVIQVVYIILVLSLWVATVYLRHHWVVDIFAGWFVTAVAVIAATWIQKRWPVC